MGGLDKGSGAAGPAIAPAGKRRKEAKRKAAAVLIKELRDAG
jgi:hypothetical protein